MYENLLPELGVVVVGATVVVVGVGANVVVVLLGVAVVGATVVIDSVSVRTFKVQFIKKNSNKKLSIFFILPLFSIRGNICQVTLKMKSEKSDSSRTK